jgi:Dopey, N-terminal
LTLLPGLEEETSDDFERTLQILDGFKAASGNVGPGAAEEEEGAHNTQYFWQCLFLASITNPSRRLGVLAYLNRYLPKLGGAFHEKNDQPNGDGSSTSYPSSIEAVVSPEPGLLVRCFATGLADEQILIQRNFLDLLVTHFPLHSPVIQGDVPEADKELLVTAAVGVVIRRDMSLNRRLWTWFLGPGNATDLGAGSAPGSPLASATDPVGLSIKADEYGKSQYLGRFGLKPLVRSLKGMISKNSLAPSDRARPFRISLSLMDRWEVGGLVVPEVFRPIMRSVQQYEDIAQSKDQFLEVLRSANVFFDGVESGLIWSEILDLVSIPEEGSSSNTEPSVANLELARFIISNFNVREEEMLIIHVPLIGLALLSMIKKLDSLTSCDDKPSPFSQQILSKSIGLTLELIDLISDRAFQVNTAASSNRDLGRQHRKWAIGTDEVVGSIQKFYVQTRENPEFAGLPFSGSEIGDLLLREASTLVSTEMSREIPDSSFKEKVHLLTALLNKVPKSEILSDGRLFGSIQSRLAPKSECDVQKLSFPAVSSMVSATISLYNVKSSAPHITYEQLSDVGVLLVQQLWSHLSPSQPNYHVEATRCIWQLQSFLWQEQILEASITGLLIGPQETDTFHLISPSSAERFAVLWNHSSLGNPGFQEGIRLSLQSHGSDQQKADAEKINYSSLLHRPLFLMLDLLSHETCDAYPIAKGWIQVAPHLAR